MDESVPDNEGATPNRLPEILGAVRNLAELSRDTDISRRMLDRYKAGTAEPTLGNAARIAKALGLPLDALVYDIDVSQARAAAESDENDHIARIPLLDVVASAGPGRANERPFEIERLPFPRAILDSLGVRERDARFLKSQGDSMYPTIPDGALLLANVSVRRPRDDGIYVLIVDGDVRLKRVLRSALGGVSLISDNETYPPEPISPADVDRLQVAGKIIWGAGKL